MQLSILQGNLNSALNKLYRVIPSKPQLPILSTILFQTDPKKNTLTLWATDLYLGIKTTLPVKVDEEVNLAIPGKIFQSIIKTLNPGKLSLSLEEETLTITSQSNKTTLQCLSAEDFPEFPELKGKKIDFPTEFLEKLESQIGFSTSIDQTRPVLTSILFNSTQDENLAVGTDGFRLATLKIPSRAENKFDLGQDFMIPARAIAEAKKIVGDHESDSIEMMIDLEQKQAIFILEKTQLFVRLIEGEYPPFEKIIPTQFQLVVKIDGSLLEEQLKRAQVFARESSNIIRLKFENAESGPELIIKAISPTFGQQKGTIPVEIVSGNTGEIAFNAKYLLDFLSAMKPEKVEFMMNESLTPALLRPEGESDYQYVVMPFRVNE